MWCRRFMSTWRVVIPSGRLGAAPVEIRSGGAAPFANGSCIARQGGSVVYANAVWQLSSTATEESFVPLTVLYRHKAAASGEVPTNPRKREMARPSEAETLAARNIDRALRPRFKGGFEIAQVSITVHSSDGIHDPVCLATNAASAAVALSGAPWVGPVGCARVGPEGGGDSFVADATGISSFDLLYATGYEEDAGAIALELGCSPRFEDSAVEEALSVAHAAAGDVARAIKKFADAASPSPPPKESEEEGQGGDDDDERWLEEAIRKEHGSRFVDLFSGRIEGEPLDKKGRGKLQQAVLEEARETAMRAIESIEFDEDKARAACSRAVERCAKQGFVEAAANGGRADRRDCDEIRPLEVTFNALPHPVHGSSFFGRGETRVLASATLDAPPRYRNRAIDNDPAASLYQHHLWRETATKRKPRRAGDSSAIDDDSSPKSALAKAFAPKMGGKRQDVPSISSEEMNRGHSFMPVAEEDDDGLLMDRRLYVHYEFPAAATGGAAAAGERRAIGHGALAERAVAAVFPPYAQFPYTTRVSVDVLSSNGSTSMAAVCAASMALADAGVPHVPVAGISVGAVDRQHLLVDLNGTEDHFGDMDFKIAGTADFVTAAQLDVKPPQGVPLSLLVEALTAANIARRHIIDTMMAAGPRPERDAQREALPEDILVLEQVDDSSSSAPVLSEERRVSWPLKEARLKGHAPRIERIIYETERLVDLIGPRGSTLKEIESTHRCVLDTTYDGEVTIFARSATDAAKAKKHVKELVVPVKIGDPLQGVILDRREFGAIVRILKNREGLLHISEFIGGADDPEKLEVGDDVEVFVTGIDAVLGNVKLSRKKPSNYNTSRR